MPWQRCLRARPLLASVEPTIRGQFENDLLRALDAAIAARAYHHVARLSILVGRTAELERADALDRMRIRQFYVRSRCGGQRGTSLGTEQPQHVSTQMT
jgi:hypothetical protein